MREIGTAAGIALAIMASVGVGGMARSAPGGGQAQVLFIVDVSGSMGEALEGATRLEVAKRSLASLLPGLDGKKSLRLGLMLYGHRTRECDDIELVVATGPGTADAINQRVQALKPVGSTPLAGSLEKAGAYLRSLTGHKQIILLTDGKETCGGDPVAVASALVGEGVDFNVHVIGFAVAGRAVSQLQAIAAAGKGQFKQADSARELENAFDDITRTIESNVLGAAKRDAAVEKEVFFEDKFEREELGSNWKLADEDPDRWVMDEGVLVITRVTESVKDAQSGKRRSAFYNTLELKKELPKNFSVEAEWEIQFTYEGNTGEQHLELVLESTKGSVVLGVWNTSHSYRPYLGRYFNKRIGERESRLSKDEKWGAGPECLQKENPVQKVRLRVLKKKFDFTAYAQRTGQEWTEIGTHKVLAAKSVRLLLRQYNEWPGSPEVEARIKHVVIREVE